MRLQQKFGMLFALLGSTAAVSVAVAVWATTFLERELGWPLESIHEVMSGLYQMKRGVEDESAAIGFMRGSGAMLAGDESEFSSDEALSQFLDASMRIDAAIAKLEDSPSYLVRSGVSTARNLRVRSEKLRSLGMAWFSSGEPQDREALGRELGSVHELIERLEGRILSDTGLAVAHGQRLRSLLLGLVSISAVIVALAGVLAMILVRRWIVQPVEVLREAAERIGSGDLSYRVDVAGSDELAALSHDVNEMAVTLAQMQDERVERERLAAVGEMARRIVHNLRKPLSGIRALAETTRTELPADSDLVEVQDRIMRAVDRFEAWLRDVLRASSPLDLQIHEVAIEQWVREVLDAHEPEAQMRGVSLVLDCAAAPERACFDAHHLGHALSAVVSNAIDFSPDGGQVEVRIGSDNDRWWIRVSDSGAGVPEDQAEAVFRAYMTTRTTGTGIGLAVARRVLEQHGGQIRVVPALERISGPDGAVFELCLGLTVARDGQQGDSIGQDSGH
jgi:signal transduction histidine kinase